MIDQMVLSLISCAALAAALTSLFMTAVVLRRMELQVQAALDMTEEIFDLPNGKGGVTLSAISGIVHDAGGHINTWVYLKYDAGSPLCLTWADGVDLEQAWREWQKR